MDLKITDIFSLQKELHSFQPDIVLSLVSDNDVETCKRNVDAFGKEVDHGIFQFHDVQNEEVGLWIPIKITDAYNIKAFLEEHDFLNKKCLVHCHAGMGRSTGASFVMLIVSGISPIEALDEILKQRPYAYPNTLVIKKLGDAFGLTIDPVIRGIYYYQSCVQKFNSYKIIVTSDVVGDMYLKERGVIEEMMNYKK